MALAIACQAGRSSECLFRVKPVASVWLWVSCSKHRERCPRVRFLPPVALALQFSMAESSGGLVTEAQSGGMETMSAHLLIVEDDPEMRDLLRKVLEKEGYRISVAGDGREATTSLSRKPFDLVVTDLLMPDDGGLELLRAIRQTHPTLPVIIITAFGDWGSYSRALELGAAAFISKPLKMAELIAAIQTALAGRGAGQAV